MKQILLITLLTTTTCWQAAATTDLADTKWQLVEFQSMSDEVGTLTPSNPERYTLWLKSDGSVAMQLNCNRGMSTWRAESGEDPDNGQFTLGPIAMTKMMCPQPSMDDDIAKDAQYIRSYAIQDEKLHLNLMADGGTYVWQRDSGQDTKEGKDEGNSEVPAEEAADEPSHWQVTANLNLREKPSTNSTILTTYPMGTVIENLGCQQHSDREWCYVQQSEGKQTGYVAAEYLRPAGL